MSTRAPLTWIGAVVGFAAQAVVLTVLTVSLVHDAVTVTPEQTRDGFTRFVVDLFGGLFYAIGAVFTGGFALLLLLVLGLSARAGGTRLAGLIVGLVLQVPVAWVAIGALGNGAGAEEVTTLVGTGLVLLAVVSPPAWRWCRRPVVRVPG